MDVETTGLDPAGDEIIQLGAALWENGRITARLNRLCRPSREVPLAVLRLTGLDPQAIAQAPPVHAALAELAPLAERSVICAHNASFDLAFLRAAAHGTPHAALAAGEPLDTLELSRLLWPLGDHTLAGLIRRLAGPTFAAHDAAADAEVTAWLLGAMVRRAAAAPPDVRALWQRLLNPVDVLLTQFLGEAERLAAGLPADDAAERVARWVPGGIAPAGATTVAEPEEAVTQPVPLLPDDIWDRRRVVGAFEKGGVLGKSLPAYEWRPGQVSMAEQVARAFDSDQLAMLEAGTGTGKSLAYLVPAAAWARTHGERVVVSTHTLALQDQLLSKDLPVARMALGAPLRAEVMKGQTQYLCLKRWHEALDGELSLGAGDRRFLARVAAWLAVTEDGDRAELNLPEAEAARWPTLAVEEHACTGRRCAFYSRCFLMNARKRADNADILVVNHALLLADLRTNGAVLPSYDRVILDEAHHLEDLAADHLGDAFERGAWMRRLLDVHRRSDRSTSGLWLRLEAAGVGAPGDGAAAGAGRRKVDPKEGRERVSTAVRAMDALFSSLAQWSGGASTGAPARGSGLAGGGAAGDSARRGRRAAGQPNGEWPLPLPDAEATLAWQAVQTRTRELATAFDRLAAILSWAVAQLGDDRFPGTTGGRPANETAPDGRDGRHEALAAEARRTADVFAEGARTVRQIVGGRDGWAAWYEAAGRRVALRAAPVDVGRILRDALFERVGTAVLTSATLSVAGRIGHLQDRLGLSPLQDRLEAAQVPSSFDYREQALLALPTDAPRLPATEGPAYWDEVVPFLTELLRASDGRALLLFNSHRALRQAAQRLRARLEPNGLAVLAQGLDGGRRRLLERLRSDPRTVICGAASFWEGIDVPGDHLQLVVVARLPFRPPGHPLAQARAEAVTAAGGDPFRQLSLPEAVLRFKQGFGRLIRTRSDRGAVVVLDPRLWHTAYGRAFLQSLPNTAAFSGSRRDVVTAVGDWLSGRRSPFDYAALQPED